MTGLNCGLWQNIEQIRKFRKIDRIFEPCVEKRTNIKKRMDMWNEAVQRFLNWY